MRVNVAIWDTYGPSTHGLCACFHVKIHGAIFYVTGYDGPRNNKITGYFSSVGRCERLRAEAGFQTLEKRGSVSSERNGAVDGRRNMNHIVLESHRSELNRRPLDYESSALPLSYCGLLLVVCPGADSNRDALRHHPLKMACLPISPPGRSTFSFSLTTPLLPAQSSAI